MLKRTKKNVKEEERRIKRTSNIKHTFLIRISENFSF